jgi:hypothetical protein
LIGTRITVDEADGLSALLRVPSPLRRVYNPWRCAILAPLIEKNIRSSDLMREDDHGYSRLNERDYACGRRRRPAYNECGCGQH